MRRDNYYVRLVNCQHEDCVFSSLCHILWRKVRRLTTKLCNVFCIFKMETVRIFDRMILDYLGRRLSGLYEFWIGKDLERKLHNPFLINLRFTWSSCLACGFLDCDTFNLVDGTLRSGRWRRHAPPNHQYLPTRQHGITTQNPAI
jgi:hypothetical protein